LRPEVGMARQPEVQRILVYSDDRTVRRSIVNALGTHLKIGMAPIECLEVATAPVVVQRADGGGLSLLILDGEAVPAGGLGLARQLKDEIFKCPPILVLTGRPEDAWLARWSRADASVCHPLDPGEVADAVMMLLAGASQ
jgi:DNA-binding response OmpR family regulator